MSLYSSLRQVLAPYAAKLNSLLTGYDGTEYNSPGEAVRSQISALHVLIGDEPGTAINASAIGYDDGNVEDALDGLNERLVNLKSAVDDSTTFPPSGRSIIQGSFNSSGNATANAARIRISGFISVAAGDTITFTAGTNTTGMLLGLFSPAKAYIRDSAWYSDGDTVKIADDGYVIVVYRKNSSNANITPEEYDAVTTFTPAVWAAINDNRSALTELSNQVSENAFARTKNLINTDENKVGYIFVSSSSSYVESVNWISTDYIPVEAGKDYSFSYGNGSGNTLSQMHVLDSNKTYIGAATKSGWTITVPSELTGAAYLVLCTNNATAKANADTWMLVSGTDTDYNYTPYYQPIYKSAIVQTTGTETDKIMSQKAVTDAVNTVASTVGNVSTVANSAYTKAEQALEAGGGSANLRYPYKVQIPAYFVDDTTNKTLYLSDKINKIKGYNADLNFVFITDLHWNLNQKKSLQLIGYIAQCIKTDAIINGGDNIGNATDMPTVSIAEYYSRQCQDAFTDVVEKDNWIYVFGNHDLNMANAGSLTDEQRTARRLSFDFVYNTYIAPWAENKVFESVSAESDLYWYSKIHYYSDDVGKNVRYIVMNTGTPYNPYASQVGETTAELYGQMDWLYNTIMSTPAGYRIIVFGHQFYASSFSGFTGGASWVSRMLRAAALKTSISLTATYLGESFARTYNFASANNIDVVGMFCGHEHGDKSAVWSGSAWNSFAMDVTDCENAGDVLVICTDSDANGATHNVSEIDRTTGTIGEQCFDVFSVDFTNKKIYATRIGAGSDREFTFA